MEPSRVSIRRLAGWLRNEAEAAGESLRVHIAPVSRRCRLDNVGECRATAELARHPRVVLDGVFFQLHRTGIARMWESVMAEWSSSGFAEQVVVLDRCDSAPKLAGFTYRRFTPLRRFDTRAGQRALEAACRAERADVFVSTYYTTPLKTPSVAVAYDMIPEVTGFDLSQPEWRAKRASFERASSFVAISQSTADDLRAWYPSLRDAAITLAYPAVSVKFFSAGPRAVEELRRRADLPSDYLVFIGSREVAYKNAALVFEALALIPRAERPGLLCVGGAPALEGELRALGADTEVRVVQLDDDELRAAYSGARALVYPSRYEGFGIPILEAMACRCPVITCRNSSLAEAAGDAAVYVPDEDPQALASAIQSLAEREIADDLRKRGAEQVARFDWGRTARVIEDRLRETAVR